MDRYALGIYVASVVILSYSLNLPFVETHEADGYFIPFIAMNELSFPSHPPTLVLIVKLLLKLHDDFQTVMRLLAMLVGALFPLSVHILVRRMHGTEVAKVVSLLFVLSPGFLLFAKIPKFSIIAFASGMFAISTGSTLMLLICLLVDWTGIVFAFIFPTLNGFSIRYLISLTLALILWMYFLHTSNPEIVHSELYSRIPSMEDILWLPVKLLRDILLFASPFFVWAFVKYFKMFRYRFLQVGLAFSLVFANLHVNHSTFIMYLLPLLFVAFASKIYKHIGLYMVLSLSIFIPVFLYKTKEYRSEKAKIVHLVRSKNTLVLTESLMIRMYAKQGEDVEIVVSDTLLDVREKPVKLSEWYVYFLRD